MSILKKFNLATKIAIGFGAVIMLLIFTMLFGYSGLSKISDDFSHYRKIAKNDVLAGKIQANLLENQINFKNFIVTGEISAQKEFEKNFRHMEELIYQAKSNIQDKERAAKIDLILKYTQEYKDGFQEIVDYRDRRNTIVLDILTKTGTELEEDLAKIMELSFEYDNQEELYAVIEAQRHFLLARLNVGKYLEDNKDNFADVVISEFSEMDKSLMEIDESIVDEDRGELLDSIHKDKNNYISSFEEVVSLIKNRNERINEINNIGIEISNVAEEIKLSIIEEQSTFGPKVKSTNDRSIVIMVVLSLVAIILSVLVSIGIIKIVVLPVKTVTNTFKGFSEGEADLKVRLEANSVDEIGKMASFFNKFMDKLEIVMNESKKQNWLKTGQSELNQKIRGEQDVINLSHNIITYICKYLNAQVGAFYLKTDENTFRLVSSYAYKKRKNISNEIKEGEGLVGQCALEKQTIVISNVPQDYVTITSGLGEAVPRNILVTPCLYHEEVKCIIELGSFYKFTDAEIEFIESISEIIAISTNSSEARAKMRELLDKSLKQTEELQLQQEELKQTNEELEEQAKALKESEANLQQQQEELRVINKELEDQTEGLTKQRDEINRKNEELERAQKEIEEKALDLENANKYKSEFLANMSHELRTPLNSILILSKLLSNKLVNTSITEKDLEFADTIYSSGNDLLDLINDILDLSKVEAGKMQVNLENMSLTELIYDIERSFRQMAIKKGLSFTTNIHDGLPNYVYTDTQRVKQIVNNLVSNSFKFTEKGSITIDISRPTYEEVKNSSVNNETAIKISVIDTGIGIPKDKQKLIFEAFRQSDGTISRKYGGTGLGLSISKELTKLLGGSIILESQEGKGTTFAIIIPERLSEKKEFKQEKDFGNQVQEELINKSDEEVAVTKVKDIELKERENKVNEEILTSQKRCILIIEDDPSFSQILIELANKKGFKCIKAENGETGIDLAAKHKPNAIILDIGLPGIDGWEVIKKLEENPITKNIPVHVISGHEEEGIESKKGIVGYLKKPVSLDKIDETFQNIEYINKKPVNNLLIVEDNKNQRFSITELFRNKGVHTTEADNGKKAYDLLKNQSFDCVILDLGLKDMSGFELLENLRKDDLLQIPVIIYTGKELSREEEASLQKYAKTIIVKGPRSMERLMSEVSLFLHSITGKASVNKSNMIRRNHEKDTDLSGKKILITDDDMRNVFALSSMLEEKNIKVIVGRNGKEGISKLNENPDTDLVFMDIMMPEMDGYTAMREIRKVEKYKKIPIIALTAKAMKEDKNKCIEAGANDYLTKPVDTQKLMSMVGAWLHK